MSDPEMSRCCGSALCRFGIVSCVHEPPADCSMLIDANIGSSTMGLNCTKSSLSSKCYHKNIAKADILRE